MSKSKRFTEQTQGLFFFFFFEFNFLSVTLRLTNWVVIAHKNDIARYKVIIPKSEIWGGFVLVGTTEKKLG